MAKPIELEVVLKGEDARAFHEYMETNTRRSTEEGNKITKEAVEISKKFCFII